MLNKKLFGAVLTLSTLAALCSCKQDPEYDLDNIDADMTVAQGLTFPLPSITRLTLGDIIDDSMEDLDQSNLKTDDEGYYYMEFEMERYPASGYEGFTLDAEDMVVPAASGDVPVHAPLEFTIPAGIPVSLAAEYIPESTFISDGSDIEFNLDSFPPEVVSLKKVEMQGTLVYTLSTSMPFKKLTLNKGSKIRYPEWLVVEGLTGDLATSLTLYTSLHTLIANKAIEIPGTGGITVGMTVSGVELQEPLDLTQTRSTTGKIEVEGSVGMSIADYIYTDGTVTTQECSVDGLELTNNYTISHMAVTSATVKISGSDLIPSFGGEQDYEVSGIPEFLNGDNSDFALAALEAHLEVDNTTPCRFDLEGTFQTKKGSTVMWTADMPKKRIAASPDNSPVRTEIILTEDDLPGLGAAICTDIDYFSLQSLDITLVDEDYITVYPDLEYGAAFNGWIKAPLAFAENSRLTLSENVDLQLDIRKDDLILPKVYLDMTVDNSLPFELSLSATPLDRDGHPLQSIRVSVDKAIAPKSITQVRLSLEMDPVDIKMESMDLNFTIRAVDDARVNRNQGIEMTNLILTLPEGITLDLNN